MPQRVVRKIDVEEALKGRAAVFSMEIQGIIGGEELRSMPLRSRNYQTIDLVGG